MCCLAQHTCKLRTTCKRKYHNPEWVVSSDILVTCDRNLERDVDRIHCSTENLSAQNDIGQISGLQHWGVQSIRCTIKKRNDTCSKMLLFNLECSKSWYICCVSLRLLPVRQHWMTPAAPSGFQTITCRMLRIDVQKRFLSFFYAPASKALLALGWM